MPSAAASPERVPRAIAAETTKSTAGPGVKQSTASVTQNASQSSIDIEQGLSSPSRRPPDGMLGGGGLLRRSSARLRRSSSRRSFSSARQF